jgi:hypothetical protein
LPTLARQKRCLMGLTLTKGKTSIHSLNLTMASKGEFAILAVLGPERGVKERLVANLCNKLLRVPICIRFFKRLQH